jgi:hypothetical protein
MGLALLRNDRAFDPTLLDSIELIENESFEGIRCPLCRWSPLPSSRWSCVWTDTPEPFFQACGTTWNTFATRGRCPGCRHQWQWTLCLECQQWSLHEDWYET